MTAVLTKASLTGFHEGYFIKGDDGLPYLMVSTGAIPVGTSALASLTTTTNIGSDWFTKTSSAVACVAPESPATVGEYGIEGAVPGLFHGESQMLAIGIGVGFSGSVGVQLDLNFTTGAAIDSRITFTRASTATYVNSSGLIASATTNTPRIDYDPVTLACKGLLIEEARTNLLPRSQEFDHSTWNSATSDVTIAADAATAPDGTNTADRFTPTAASSAHKVYRQITPTVVSTAHAYSVYVKANGYNYAVLSAIYANTSAGVSFIFDLNAKTATVLSNVGWTASGYASDAGNGWVRCVMVFTNPASDPADYFAVAASPTATPSVDAASRTPTYTGDGTSGLYIWGAQLEAGAFATSYIPTTSATVTRAADVASMTGTNFSSWYRQDEGTFVVEIGDSNGSTARFLTVSDGLINNQAWLKSGAGGASMLEVYTAGAFVAQIIPSGVAGSGKVAGTIKANDFAVSSNGNTVGTDTAGSIATYDRMHIGTNYNGSATFLNGHIRRLTYYPSRLSNAQLQSLSA